MQVISGKYRGRKLTCPQTVTRPTLGRVKETMFNIIQFEISGKKVLDLFGGSGALGIECASRGARCVNIIDNDAVCVQFARNNAKGIDEVSVTQRNYVEAINSYKGSKYDLIFIDPPFDSNYYDKAIATILSADILEDRGIIVCEHIVGVDIACPAGLGLYKYRKVGTVQLTYFIKE